MIIDYIGQKKKKKKKNVLFPETSQYFLGSVARNFFFFGIFLFRKKHENRSFEMP